MRKVVLDVCEINALLPKDISHRLRRGGGPCTWAVRTRSRETGRSAPSQDSPVRTANEDIWNNYTEYYEDEQWLDTFVMSAIEGTGAFAGEPDLVRRQAIQKGIQNQIMLAWTFHELVSALAKAAEGTQIPLRAHPTTGTRAGPSTTETTLPAVRTPPPTSGATISAPGPVLTTPCWPRSPGESKPWPPGTPR